MASETENEKFLKDKRLQSIISIAEAEIVKRLKPNLDANFNTSDSVYVENNLVKLHVFFKQMVYKNYTESPSYSGIQYISDLGGVFGLWFGFAVLALAEICEFTTDFIMLGIWHFIKSRTNRKP